MRYRHVTRMKEPYELFSYTAVYFILAFVGAVFLLGRGNFDEGEEGKYLVLLVLCGTLLSFFYGLYKFLAVRWWLDKRDGRLAEYLGRTDAVRYLANENARTAASLTMREIAKRDLRYENVVTNDEWVCGDFSHAIYVKSKYGEHKSATLFYYMGYIQLPRKLPHVFFDAKATEGKEFARIFDSSQKHSLEGDFDKYFDTYFPIHYSIDGLSFITPEVMQVMIALKDYDIEIIGDRLYMSCPLRRMPGQLIHMSDGLTKLKKALLNNITTYRDERLPYGKGRQEVSLIGMRLRRSLVSSFIRLALGLLFIIGAFGVLLASDNLNPINWFIIGTFFTVSGGLNIKREKKERAMYDGMQRSFLKKRDRVKSTHKSSNN